MGIFALALQGLLFVVAIAASWASGLGATVTLVSLILGIADVITWITFYDVLWTWLYVIGATLLAWLMFGLNFLFVAIAVR